MISRVESSCETELVYACPSFGEVSLLYRLHVA
jgi:hypothetical protein